MATKQVFNPLSGQFDTVSEVTIGTANGLSITAAQALSLALASTSTTGALSSTDWNTFNGKQAAGNYITALTGDATASGPGSAALTLATVNSNVGSFGSATQVGTFTVNAKGLITAASNTNIAIAFSQVSGTVPIAQGGTGQTTQTAGFDALSPTTTKGDIIVDDGTNAVRLPVGITTGFTLQVDPSAATGVKWAAPLASAPSELRLNTGNGFGSTNTVIRRFANVVQNIGSDITYTDSAANGASFTINTNGVYAITYTEEGNTGSPIFGISLNSASLTTDINAIAIGEILTISNVGNGNGRACSSWTGLLSATDVVRMHTNNGSATFADNVQVFTIVGPF